MAEYAISKKGVEDLRKLANDLSTLNNDIEANGKKLTATVSGLSGDLGIFEEKILDLIAAVNSTQEKGRESVEVLVVKVNELADDVEAIVNSGL